MVRKTKEDALATRDSILDAAELLFVAQGMSGTTLQHIASAAGLTRGAIYWHFEDKAALFNALMERAKMPLESALQLLEKEDPTDPLGDIREYIVCVFRLTVDDLRARRAFEIATLKMEFVEEMNAVRRRRAEMTGQWMLKLEGRVRIGIEHGLLKPDVDAKVVALGLFALLDGLLRAWLLDPQSFDLVKVGEQIIDTHLECLRAVK
ncbi:TetR family transcriptional regulator [Massilia soli]|uniref:TetR family transcriptional regulator n=1 Tax=Massilia soli TaxID=2792854 RepID=A0ABS7SVG8_9BURK|nr:TetR family transcriptional regulator [Massilia soli]MBZ2209920.1 TetR family transcriptional regulator [Massilia soli]